MSGRMARATGWPSSATRRARWCKHADMSLGALAVETARGHRGRRADGRPDRRLHGQSCSPRRAPTRSWTASALVSANWLAEHLGVNPRYAAGFQGFGQMPGAVALAVNAVASGAADYVLVHRALHNPAGQLPRESDADAAGASSGPRPRATSAHWP